MKTKDFLNNKEFYIEKLRLKNYDIEPIAIEIEKEYKKLKKSKASYDLKREEVNRISREIAKVEPSKRKEMIDRVQFNKEKINKLQIEYRNLEDKIKNLILSIPNLPSEESPKGKDENSNKVVKEVNKVKDTKKTFKPHWDLIKEKDLVNLDVSSEMSGTRFVIYKNNGAKLINALKNFMLDTHTNDGYELYDMPIIVNSQSLVNTGQLPKFEDDLYSLGSGKWLIPTTEVTLTNLYANKNIDKEKLPIKVTSFSNCFRKEAGATGRDTKGLKRLHQFNKVELVHIVDPKDNSKMLDQMLKQAEKILKLLKLPYRISALSTGELTFTSSFTYDLEVWMPGVGEYMEVSSVSSTDDFQAKRMNTTFSNDGKKEYVYTQNGSALALDRIAAAIIENNQDAKGFIKIPKVLVPYMSNLEKI